MAITRQVPAPLRIVNARRRCVVKNPARGGGRWIEVAPERLVTWVDSFAAGHQGMRATVSPRGAKFTAGDGAVAECQVPFPPLPTTAGGAVGGEPGEAARLLAGHAAAGRTVGVLLVRLGGYAAGVFTGSPPRLAASKVGSRLVHGRSAAGGQSQQRFARRREKQAAEALAAAAGTAAAVLGPYRDRLQAVVLGGDRRAVDGLRGDPRLSPYFALATDRFLTVPDPRLAVLRDSPRLFRAIRIRLTEPPPPEG
ncbi:MAG TPA: acVLRF1 family peptidyl-tRNA hydrolase [Streptosporangiaceae bacterium]